MMVRHHSRACLFQSLSDKLSDIRGSIPVGYALLSPPLSPANSERVCAADLIWTSGENFKFEQTSSDRSRCNSPTILSGEGRLSLGMLDLSGASDPNFGSDCGTEDVSAISPHATINSANTTVACVEYNVSHTSASPMGTQGRKAKTACAPSPGRILDNSVHSASNNSLNLSQMPTTAAARDKRQNLNTSGSPLHPQRLFNPGAGGGGGLFPAVAATQKQPADMQQSADTCATPAERLRVQSRGSSSKGKGAFHEPNDVLSSLDRPARRLSEPIRASPGRLRHNPFLPTQSVGSRALTMNFWGESSVPLTVRSFLEDFDELKEIGRGSFGRVFSCRRKIDLCWYAVKEINNEFRSERERERLLREIYALSTQGDNVHVVRYFSAWEQDDKLYIQTELCTGSLEDVRRRKSALGEDAVRDILVQVATGLAFMHAHNMAHLDVKPDNIYTTKRGIYKLGDHPCPFSHKLVCIAVYPTRVVSHLFVIFHTQTKHTSCLQATWGWRRVRLPGLMRMRVTSATSAGSCCSSKMIATSSRLMSL